MDVSCSAFDNPTPTLLIVFALFLISLFFLSSILISVLFGAASSSKKIHSVINWDYEYES